MNILILTNEENIDFVHYVVRAAGLTGATKIHFDFVNTIGNYDIGISYMYAKKVPKSEIERATWFNFHPAPLPDYKGRNLCYHAIRNGETEFGASLHYMDENFDTGDIIKVRKFDILPWMNSQDVSQLAQVTSVSLFWEYLPRIAKGEQFERIKNVGGRYYKREPINEVVEIPESLKTEIRSITFQDFHPVAYIGDVKYKIVRDV